MAVAISMPRLGMTMEEGTVIQWSLNLGEYVEKGDVVLIIESEKAEVDIEAPESGFLRHTYIQEDQTVPCGTLLAAITSNPDEAFDADAFRADAENLEEEGAGGLQVQPASDSSPKQAEGRADRATQKPVVPAARALARKLGIDPQAVPGTGPNGRVTKQDVETYASQREGLVAVTREVSLEVVKDGSGDPVVLLPGLGVDVSSFARQAPVLSEGFCVHGVNPRGVGLSDAPNLDAYEVGQTAIDAAGAYEGAGHVIGASLGAAAALELAITQPDRVRTLTLITPFVEATPRLLAVASAWQRLSAEATPETLALALLPWFFSADFLADDSARARTLRGLAQTLVRVPPKTLERTTAGMADWSGSRAADLSGISIPTLVISAGEDLLTPAAEVIAEAIPDSKLVSVEGAGHAVALEAPDVVNQEILSHID